MKEILKKKEYAIFIFVHPAQSNYTVHSIISAVNKMDLKWKFLLTLLSSYQVFEEYFTDSWLEIFLTMCSYKYILHL